MDHGAMALADEEFKLLFLDFVERAKKKFGFKLWNFTVMDNHIHFLIKPDEGVSLSKIMQWIKCNFAKKWNKMHNTKGHLWGERFFSRIIKDEEDFAGASTYIDENPVKANLVKEAKDWKFGGLFYKLCKNNKPQGMFTLVDELLEGDFCAPVFPVFQKTAPPAVSPG
jgi:REP element-mobilizing transposase RayT